MIILGYFEAVVEVLVALANAIGGDSQPLILLSNRSFDMHTPNNQMHDSTRSARESQFCLVQEHLDTLTNSADAGRIPLLSLGEQHLLFELATQLYTVRESFAGGDGVILQL